MVNDRYRTLFYGLKRNHEHNVAVVFPVAFLLRRILYVTVILFLLKIPMLSLFILCFTCVGMLAYIFTER